MTGNRRVSARQSSKQQQQQQQQLKEQEPVELAIEHAFFSTSSISSSSSTSHFVTSAQPVDLMDSSYMSLDSVANGLAGDNSCATVFLPTHTISFEKEEETEMGGAEEDEDSRSSHSSTSSSSFDGASPLSEAESEALMSMFLETAEQKAQKSTPAQTDASPSTSTISMLPAAVSSECTPATYALNPFKLLQEQGQSQLFSGVASTTPLFGDFSFLSTLGLGSLFQPSQPLQQQQQQHSSLLHDLMSSSTSLDGWENNSPSNSVPTCSSSVTVPSIIDFVVNECSTIDGELLVDDDDDDDEEIDEAVLPNSSSSATSKSRRSKARNRHRRTGSTDEEADFAMDNDDDDLLDEDDQDEDEEDEDMDDLEEGASDSDNSASPKRTSAKKAARGIGAANGSNGRSPTGRLKNGGPRTLQDFIDSLSDQERRGIMLEKVDLKPSHILSKGDEKMLRKLRRKVRNKISAQESRKKKKEYMSKLEEDVMSISRVNSSLQTKVTKLKDKNKTLVSQLKRLRSLLGSVTESLTGISTGQQQSQLPFVNNHSNSGGLPSAAGRGPNVRGMYLLMLLLSFSLFSTLPSSLPGGNNLPGMTGTVNFDATATAAAAAPPLSQSDRFRSRTLKECDVSAAVGPFASIQNSATGGGAAALTLSKDLLPSKSLLIRHDEQVVNASTLVKSEPANGETLDDQASAAERSNRTTSTGSERKVSLLSKPVGKLSQVSEQKLEQALHAPNAKLPSRSLRIPSLKRSRKDESIADVAPAKLVSLTQKVL